MLVPFWEFWAASAREDLPTRLEAIAAQAAAALPGVDIVTTELLLSPDATEEVAAGLRGAAPDALLVLQVMAVPPGRTAAVLDRVPDLPLVVWGIHLEPSAGRGYDHSDIATEGATVGTSQLLALLTRDARPLALHVGRLGDPATTKSVADALLAASAARRISTGTLARVGREPDGYDCVVCDTNALTRAIGLRVVETAPTELARRFHAVDESDLAGIAAEASEDFEVEDGLAETDEGLRRSLRFAAALERFDAETGVSVGALNCHLPELRFEPSVGIAPCFALGRETSRGTPWACAGDLLTAVALLTTKLLGHAALYHELETIDYETDELVIANTGEHDLAWARPGAKPQLRRNGWFAADPVCGVCACFSPPPGPATLVAFAPSPQAASGFRYVVAEGSFTDRAFPSAGTPNGGFRFKDRSAVDGFRAWALSGANHHSSSTPGHIGGLVAQVAGHLGVDVLRIS
jgi:L-arabinose isomerase